MPDPAGCPLDILFEDAHLLIVSKPPGLLSQGKRGAEPTLEDRIRSYLSPSDPFAIYLGTVHRLDRPVSGVIAWAKTEKAARRLSEQFAAKVPHKTYLAVLAPRDEGSPPLKSGTWDDLISPVGPEGVASIPSSEHPNAKRAVTDTTILGRHADPTHCVVELRPRTGRTHQLRAQCAHRGWPIVGDAAYGSRLEPPARGAIALHARRLEFAHPRTGQPLKIEAPLPPEWSGWSGADGLRSRAGLS